MRDPSILPPPLLVLLLVLLLASAPLRVSAQAPCYVAVGETSEPSLLPDDPDYCMQQICTIGGIWASRADALWIGVDIFHARHDLSLSECLDQPGDTEQAFAPVSMLHENYIPAGGRPPGLGLDNTDAEIRETLLRSFSASTCATGTTLATQCEAKLCGYEFGAGSRPTYPGCHDTIRANQLTQALHLWHPATIADNRVVEEATGPEA
jgi:hypothetical protein